MASGEAHALHGCWHHAGEHFYVLSSALLGASFGYKYFATSRYVLQYAFASISDAIVRQSTMCHGHGSQCIDHCMSTHVPAQCLLHSGVRSGQMQCIMGLHRQQQLHWSVGGQSTLEVACTMRIQEAVLAGACSAISSWRYASCVKNLKG